MMCIRPFFSASGIAGLATAVALQRVGIPCSVVEAAPAPREDGAAIGIWSNGWRALDALGVSDELRRSHLALNRVELCRNSGQVLRSFGFSECEGGPHEFRG